MTGALWYLLRTTGSNRLRRKIVQLKNPRYAIALGLGLLYFWFIFFREGRPEVGESDLVTNPVIMVLVPLFFIGAIAYAWIAGADRSALAFTEAEVAMLFPAPLSRRALILYKLARSQLTIIFTTAVWVLLLGSSSGEFPVIIRAVSLWMLLSTFTLHRLGVALLRSSVTSFGAGGLRRSAPAILAFSAMLAAVVFGLWDARATISGAADPQGMIEAVVLALQLPPAGIALLPFQLMFAPLLAPTTSAWLSAVGPAFLIFVLHVWWVLRIDAAFEEVAAEASTKVAKKLTEMRARRGGITPATPTSAKRSLRLSPVGHPAIAILWKNSVWILRTGQLRGVFLPGTIALGATYLFARTSPPLAVLVTITSLMLSVVLLLFGPVTIRADLRSDLLRLPLLKTFPLSGRDVVLAQVTSGALAVSLGQTLLVVAAGIAFTFTPEAAKLSDGARFALMGAAPIILFALNIANFTLHNGLALLFPAWTKLGGTSPGGIEATGQMMIISIATIVTLLLLLILPVIGAGVAVALLRANLVGGILVGASIAAALLVAEGLLLIQGLGRAYDRVEPIQTL